MKIWLAKTIDFCVFCIAGFAVCVARLGYKLFKRK